jgi:phosphoglycerate dehydrogenase-like enzyme
LVFEVSLDLGSWILVLFSGSWILDLGSFLNVMSWKVLITASGFARAGKQAESQLREAGCQLVFAPKLGPLKAPVLTPLLDGMDAVVASLDEYCASVLESSSASGLKMIARWGVGYDSVDLAAASKAGIIVTYTPGLLNEAVADYAFALLLASARRVPQGNAAMLQSQWQPTWGTDVAGKTLGIIGPGRIGMAVARRAQGFNMRLLAYGPTPKPEAAKLGVSFVSLDELLAQSDFVSLHAALTPQTRGLIGKVQLNRMKPSAHFINTARGALVDEFALARALSEGRIAGAALDVFTTEPLPADSPLRAAPNLLLSPHQGSFAHETGERVSLAVAQGILDLIAGRQPINILNPEAFKSRR